MPTPAAQPRSPDAGQTSARAPVLEVFASIQGEGLYVGEPQVFLRLRGCPLRCAWCDTPGSWTLSEADTARVAAGAQPRREPAWATPFRVACWIAAAETGSPRTISVTGGEPLLWPRFLRELRALVGERRVHLETAGAHPRALESVLDCVDHVSLDLKAPGDLDAPVEVEGAGEERAPRDAREWAAVRRAVLPLLRGRDACAKLVVAGGRAPGDFDELLDDLVRHAPDLPLVLQPVTPVSGLRGRVAAPGRELLESLVERARERGLSVRVLPQVHRALGLP